jgi:16S rRNA (guanine527-N7)-methyltransferase
LSEQRLRLFAELVRRWSGKINLVSRGDLPYLWERHIQDSLLLLPLIPDGTACAIDLGSGAGFPGLVLAIATGIPFTLIEADARKAAFLMEAARETQAPATVLNCRIEQAKTNPAPLITARALAPLDRLLALAAPHLAQDGVCLFPKGQKAGAEISQAAQTWHMEAEQHPTPDGCILKVSNLRHAGATPHHRDF